MTSLSNFMVEELRIIPKQEMQTVMNIMSTQQVEKKLTALSASIWIPVSTPVQKPATRPVTRHAIRFLFFPIPRPRTRWTSEPLPTDMDKSEKMKWQKPGQYQKILGISGTTG